MMPPLVEPWRRIYIAEVRWNEPFWSFVDRPLIRAPPHAATAPGRDEDIVVDLVNIVNGFMYAVLRGSPRCRSSIGRPRPRTWKDVETYLTRQLVRRISFPGDVVAALLFVLRWYTSSAMVPNLVEFDGNWDAPRDQRVSSRCSLNTSTALQNKASCPEVVLLHGQALRPGTVGTGTAEPAFSA